MIPELAELSHCKLGIDIKPYFFSLVNGINHVFGISMMFQALNGAYVMCGLIFVTLEPLKASLYFN